MSRYLRGFFIVWVVLRYGLDELVLSGFPNPLLRALRRVITIGRNLKAPRGQRLREALEALGPIFVKFGQCIYHTFSDLSFVQIILAILVFVLCALFEHTRICSSHRIAFAQLNCFAAYLLLQ